MPELVPKDLNRKEQSGAATLLRKKLAAANPGASERTVVRFRVDDALDLLQLAVMASKVDPDSARQAVILVHNWVGFIGEHNLASSGKIEFGVRRKDHIAFAFSLLQRKLRHTCDRLGGRHGVSAQAIESLRSNERALRELNLAFRVVDKRRNALQALAKREFASMNRAQALVNTIAGAVKLLDLHREPGLEFYKSRSKLMMEDLFAVIIGRGMLSGRLQGDYFVGVMNGSGGFKPNMRDRHFQAQHAMAGLYIGYSYTRFGEWGAEFLEWMGNEPQDVALYKATGPLGRSLTDANYRTLAQRLVPAIGDNTVKPPPP